MNIQYVIYKIEPSVLSSKEEDGYYLKDINRSVLIEIGDFFRRIKSKHDSFDQALMEIESHKEELRGMNLTILPQIYIGYID